MISRRLLTITLLAIPVVLFLLPANYFDTGESLCLSRRLLDMECLGCGLTRGIQHLIHLDFAKAWEYNKLSFVVLPAIIYLWARYLIRNYRPIFSK